ncbi:cation:proton antiporter [Campylobacter canadensis]|uniref:cation:proton antiporter n=1 Tax=Campylobacter canadensis TaxID=449520 RepID=UPI0015569A1C|nr:cation:proton antiporter [Campylobacter canadensis]MBZ7994675.1 cation:proton antiporter [Campylobacter canadensis]MBZ7996171.1 cation:proton antiporter [Campylobacter canadensis]MBZ8000013.1 cation:proton antiporter [Campylobacter canadensis]MBZ8001602.1 cation:proton antiporter [Campylobacter canadensis]MBZ8003304.1 cation:proton antiporter [Campylobacter canadensis]
MKGFLEIFLITAAIAIVLNVVLKKFSIPTIIGYIFTGLIVGLSFNIHTNPEINHIAEFGIVFLMFSIGLEFSIKHLMTMKTEVFLNGALQMCLSGLIFAALINYFFNINENTSLILGFTLGLSSTAIVLKILNETSEINQVFGRKTLGILLFQDIAVIPLLLMIDIFNSSDSASSLIIKTLVSAIIVLSLLFFIGKYVFNRVLYYVIKTKSQEIFIATILFTIVGASYLAHIFGFSYSLGAFIAGMLIAETEYKHQIEADLIPFRDLLLGFFFVTVGLQIDVFLIIKYWYIVIILTFVIMSIKAAVVYMFLQFTNTKSNSFKTALCLCQIGEFALAVFGLLSSHKMIDDVNSQLFTLSVILSMIIAPFIIKNNKKLSSWANDEVSTVAPKIQSLSNHFVIFGYGTLGQEVVLKLKNQGIPYLVIDSDINLVELGQKRGENVYQGNVEQDYTLQAANIKTCAAVIITVSNETRLELISKKVVAYSPETNVIMRFSKDEHKIFDDFSQKVVLIKEEKVVAKTMLQEALKCRIANS